MLWEGSVLEVRKREDQGRPRHGFQDGWGWEDAGGGGGRKPAESDEKEGGSQR